METVDRAARRRLRGPARVHFVTLLPKTRSGKLLRRSIQALAEGRDPGDLTTIEDPGALEQIRSCDPRVTFNYALSSLLLPPTSLIALTIIGVLDVKRRRAWASC